MNYLLNRFLPFILLCLIFTALADQFFVAAR